MTPYQETTARLREVNAALVSDEAKADRQMYEQLADEQITLMNRAVSLLARSLVDQAAQSAHHFTLSPEAALDLAHDTLVRSGLVW